MTRRRVWMLVHRVNGLLLAGFLTVVGTTGALLAWKAPLERVFAPRLFILPSHAPNAVRIDPVTVRESVARAYPWADVSALDLSTKPDLPLEFSITPKAEAAVTEVPPDDEAYADPYNGHVLGSRRNADLHQGWKNAVPFVYALHESLALGEWGTTLLGAAALLWTFDCFVGMYLTFPPSRRHAGYTKLQRFRAWPRRWAPAWLIRWRQGSYKRLYDVHRASGIWPWVLLLIFAWTGVIFNLPAVAKPVLHVFGGHREPSLQDRTCAEETRTSSEVGWRSALKEARREMANEARHRGFSVREERFLSYDRQQCEWTYRVRSTLDIDRIGNTQLQWAANMQRARFSAPTGVSRVDTVTTWMEAIHESQIGGNGFRLSVCLCGFVVALLSITGVWIFVRKLRG